MPVLLSDADFRDTHVFIAGGSSGINLGIAHRFAEFGARLSICSRSAERVEGAVGELQSHGGDVFGTSADVRDYGQIDGALKEAAARHGPIHTLIAGQAGNFVAPALGMSANGFRTVVDIDLNGSYNVFRAGFDHLVRPGASCIAISAPQAIHAYSFQTHVCAAKAGLDMLCRGLALEWAPMGVRVNTIIPGPIEGTEGMERLAPTEAAKQAAADMTPMKRFGRKSEVGDAALFLASPMAAYITGGNIPVDGGTVLTGSSSMSRGMEMALEGAAHKTGDVVKNKQFKTQGDFISAIMDKHCRTAEGKVDVPLVAALCSENGVILREYPNQGMVRMNAGNMLRSRARKRHGLNVNGKFVAAPKEFTDGHERTENPDGSAIAARGRA